MTWRSMPPLTRSAAKACTEDIACLGLRSTVTPLKDTVVTFNNDTDLYTLEDARAIAEPNVDHKLEVQLCELAFAKAYTASGARVGSMATLQAHEHLRARVNDVPNLNVTSRRVNQAKRGPMTAAVRRLSTESLRDVSAEQLARQGQAKWLVDNGTWARIETAIVAAYDHLDRDTDPVLIDAGKLVDATGDELHAMLTRLKLF